jgi:hypothetical protein
VYHNLVDLPTLIVWAYRQPQSGAGGGSATGSTGPGGIEGNGFGNDLPDFGDINTEPAPLEDDFERLNVCEVAYFGRMFTEGKPIHIYAGAMLQNERIAIQEIRKYDIHFGDTGDEPLNAAKHAIFQALNACSMPPGDAMALSVLHEGCPTIVNRTHPNSQLMDMRNNAVGFAIRDEVGCANTQDLIDAVLRAFENHRLFKFDGTPTP